MAKQFTIQADVDAKKDEEKRCKEDLKALSEKEKYDKKCEKESPLCFARIKALEDRVNNYKAKGYQI